MSPEIGPMYMPADQALAHVRGNLDHWQDKASEAWREWDRARKAFMKSKSKVRWEALDAAKSSWEYYIDMCDSLHDCVDHLEEKVEREKVEAERAARAEAEPVFL